MKLSRVLILAAVLIGGFVAVTSRPEWIPAKWRRPLAQVQTASYRPDPSLWSGPDIGRAAGLSSDELNNIDVYKTAHTATVNITSTVYRRDFFWNVYPAKESGSGFIVNDEGLIITNNHVISGSAKLQVTLADQSRYEAQILDRDPSNDLALIKIVPKKKITPLRLGDSDKLQVGQKVLAIGNPFGLEGTLTTGIISSLGRSIKDESGRELEGMVQTDAAINPGNSGGALINARGELVGINTAIFSQSGGYQGIGFAVPSNLARHVLDDFLKYGAVRRGTIGFVEFAPLTSQLAEQLGVNVNRGVVVSRMRRNSPAFQAGLQPLDVITAFNGQSVADGSQLQRLVQDAKIGAPATFRLMRDGRTMDLKIPIQSTAAR